MGRPERALFPDLDPLHAFANDLRQLRRRAGNPTYKAMARRTGRSSTALSDAAGGDKMPTWKTVVAYVSFCGEDPNRYRVAWENAGEQRRSRQESVTGYDPSTLPEAPPLLANLPRHPARFFLGRDDELAEMDDLLRTSENGLVIGSVLHGLGGIGKTELALQFAYRHQGEYNPVWWISADTAENITAGLAALTRSLEPRWPASAGVADTAAWAARWLATHGGWLLVLDNVADLSAIEPVLATASNGRVIATSRRYLDWRALGLTPMLISGLTVEASVDLLTRRSGRRSNQGELEALAGEFGGLPLALSHAAAYLVERPHVTLVQYRAWLGEQPSRIFGALTLAHPSDALVARTWQVSIEAVAADPLAINILDVVAYLAADRIPNDLLTPLADTLAVDDAVTLLASYSMVSRSGMTVSVHRLVQAVIRIAHTDAAALATAIDLLQHALPTDDPEIAMADWARWAELAPHVTAMARRLTDKQAVSLTAEQVDQASDVLQRCAFYHRGQGRYGTALAFFEQSLKIREEALGADHPSSLTSRYVLAGGYWSIGRFEEAVELATSTLAARRAALGPDHPDTLQNATHVALGLRELGRLDEATALTEATLSALERVLGVDHPETLRSRNNLAGCYRAAGRHNEAMTIYQSTLDDRRRVLGDLHPDTLQSQHNLAGGYEAVGRLDEAIVELKATLATRVELLGPDHPDTSHTRFNLARACRTAGWHKLAVALLEETVQSRQWLLGPEHPDTRKAEASLAEARSNSA